MPNVSSGPMSVRYLQQYQGLALDQSWHKYHPIQSDYDWPKMVKPSATDWNNWDVALASVFQVGRYHTLPHKIGTFFQTKWLVLCSGQTSHIAVQQQQVDLTQHNPLQSQMLSFHRQGEPKEPLDKPLHLATVQVQDTKVILMGSGPIAPPTNNWNIWHFYGSILSAALGIGTLLLLGVSTKVWRTSCQARDMLWVTVCSKQEEVLQPGSLKGKTTPTG